MCFIYFMFFKELNVKWYKVFILFFLLFANVCANPMVMQIYTTFFCNGSSYPNIAYNRTLRGQMCSREQSVQ